MSRISQANIANSRWLPPNLVSHLITSDGSDGQLALLEVVMKAGGELPAHVHQREDEFFYVLDGQFVFEAGEKQMFAPKGSFVWLPRGVRHEMRAYPSEGKILMGFLPGCLEQWFLENSSPAEFLNLPPQDEPSYHLDLEARVRASAEHGLFFDSPSPSLGQKSRPFARVRDEAKIHRLDSKALFLLARREETDGALTSVEISLEPEASVPINSRSETEIAYVLEGQALYQIGETKIEVGAGTALLISRGALSGYQNVGPDRLVVLHLVFGDEEPRPCEGLQ